MFFNSLTFFVFFTIVLGLYFSLPHRWQNRMLLAASYVFYGWWDWRFLSLILISTVVDYYCGLKIHAQRSAPGKRKYIILSVIVNLTLLGFFKYYNFFIDSFIYLLSQFGWNLHPPLLNIILPVGISFYTFQTMTYSIDIYRGHLEPTTDFLDFALFVSFFPQLVAGPIERASALLPQISSNRTVRKDTFLRGLQLIYWGLFKKVFVADNLGPIVDSVYGAPSATGWEYIIATWAFAWQIYCDFSGYTDIARGVARCMGIELQLNFRQPYLVTNPSDFWRHWHISLSSWLRDYLYIPLGGNRSGTYKTYRNLIVSMILGGLWHGAGWTFVLWGAFHGGLLCLFRMFRKTPGKNLQTDTSLIRYLIKCFCMFQIICISWIFFRATSLNQVVLIFRQILSIDIQSLINKDALALMSKVLFFIALPLFVMVSSEFKERFAAFAPQWMNRALNFTVQPVIVKSGAYGVLTYLLFLYGAKAQSFIYFQF